MLRLVRRGTVLPQWTGRGVRTSQWCYTSKAVNAGTSIVQSRKSDRSQLATSQKLSAQPAKRSPLDLCEGIKDEDVYPKEANESVVLNPDHYDPNQTAVTRGDDKKDEWVSTPTWYGLGMCDELRHILKKDGIPKCSNATQAECLPPMLEGKNVVIQALPDSGLTTAYCLLVCDRALRSLAQPEPPADGKKKKSRKELAERETAVVSTQAELDRLKASQRMTSFGPRALILVRNQIHVASVVERFNHYFGKAFRAAAVSKLGELVVEADTAVIVTTPGVAKRMDYTTLMRRITTVIFDNAMSPIFMKQLAELRPPYTPPSQHQQPQQLTDGSEETTSASLLPGQTKRQFVVINASNQCHHQAKALFAKPGDEGSVAIRPPFDAMKYRKPAIHVNHYFMPVKAELSALETVVKELLSYTPSLKRGQVLRARDCKRVILIAAKNLSAAQIRNLFRVIAEPSKVSEHFGVPWFQKYHTPVRCSGDLRTAFTVFNGGTLPLLLTTQEFIFGMRFKAKADIVMWYGLPDPASYLLSCRYLNRRGARVKSIYNAEDAPIADFLKAVSQPSHRQLEEAHNHMLKYAVFSEFNKQQLKEMAADMERVTAASIYEQQGTLMDVDVDRRADEIGEQMLVTRVRKQGGKPLEAKRNMAKRNKATAP